MSGTLISRAYAHHSRVNRRASVKTRRRKVLVPLQDALYLGAGTCLGSIQADAAIHRLMRA
jgi:hypothetical protein